MAAINARHRRASRSSSSSHSLDVSTTALVYENMMRQLLIAKQHFNLIDAPLATPKAWRMNILCARRCECRPSRCRLMKDDIIAGEACRTPAFIASARDLLATRLRRRALLEAWCSPARRPEALKRGIIRVDKDGRSAAAPLSRDDSIAVLPKSRTLTSRMVVLQLGCDTETGEMALIFLISVVSILPLPRLLIMPRPKILQLFRVGNYHH